MKIRDYTPSDKKQIIEMVSNILSRIFNGNPTQFGYIKEFNSNKNYIKFLVAEIDNKVVATMGIKKIDKKRVRLKRMYVAREYQRRGIAQKLLNQLIQIAREKGYKKMILSTYPTMEHANIFYKKNGFKEFEAKPVEQIHVMKRL
ncbi:MAG: GNAT family N-acetyltransferase [Nanoarchaeota archaeon]